MVGAGATVVVAAVVLAIVYTGPIVDAIAEDGIGEGEGGIHGWWMGIGAVACTSWNSGVGATRNEGYEIGSICWEDGRDGYGGGSSCCWDVGGGFGYGPSRNP